MTTTRTRRAVAATIVASSVFIAGAPSAIATPTSDVAVTLESEPAAFAPRGPGITAHVTNVGPSPARAVSATLELPAALTAWTSSESCSADGQIVTCAVGDLRSGETRSVYVHTRAGATGAATVTAKTTSDRADANPGDNVATATTRVYASPTLEVVDTPDPSVRTGVITYKVVVRNPNDVALPLAGGTAKIAGYAMVHRYDSPKVSYLAATTSEGEACDIVDEAGDEAYGFPEDSWTCNVPLPPGETTITATVALRDVWFSTRLPQWTVVNSTTGPSFGAMEIEYTDLLPNSILY